MFISCGRSATLDAWLPGRSNPRPSALLGLQYFAGTVWTRTAAMLPRAPLWSQTKR